MKTGRKQRGAIEVLLSEREADAVLELLAQAAELEEPESSEWRTFGHVTARILDKRALSLLCSTCDGSGCPTCDPCRNGRHRSGRCS